MMQSLKKICPEMLKKESGKEVVTDRRTDTQRKFLNGRYNIKIFLMAEFEYVLRAKRKDNATFGLSLLISLNL